MPELQRGPQQVFCSPVADSRRWDEFKPRDGDIVIATFPKCGTTWMQRIVDLLVHQSPDVRPFGDISRWLDATIFTSVEQDLATLEAQTHRRYVKSHLPFDALPVWDTVRYIHVGRDPRDARLSWKNHDEGFLPEVKAQIGARAMAAAAAAGAAPSGPPPAPPEDPGAYLMQWIDDQEAGLGGPGAGAASFLGFERSYWEERRRPNLLLVHYNDLKEDLGGEMRRISDFLEIPTPESLMPALVRGAAFETMKQNGDAMFPELKGMFDRGADRFINQGRSGRWRDVLSPADVARYEATVGRAATPALAAWLAGGRRAAGEPASTPD
ncbi:MAG TPA: sulfotransferase domain-containing protein [Caulobacteraceae bacterium]|jgi:aryl sulfotransferase|nr:sulfotransferase domain-containing protein [Caulobacteraceae bacterium]